MMSTTPNEQQYSDVYDSIVEDVEPPVITNDDNDPPVIEPLLRPTVTITTMNDVYAITHNNNHARNIDANVLVALSTERKTGIVYVVLDGHFSKRMMIKVMEGDDLISIKKKIKEETRPKFDLVGIHYLILFKSSTVGMMEFTAERTSTPLDPTIEIPLSRMGHALSAFTEWHPHVSWGTKDQPLIVVYSPPPTMSRNSEYSVFLCV